MLHLFWIADIRRRLGAVAGLALLETVVIFCVFSVRGGWLVPSSGDAFYLSRAKHFWDSTWCPNDFFLNTPDAHLVFDSTFGLLTLILSLPATAVCGRILEWSLLAWSWQRMSSAIVEVPFSSLFSAILFTALDHVSHVAGEWVIGGPEAKCFAYAFVFFAVAAMAGNRWNHAWMLLGLASAFHILVGGWTALAAIFTWLLGVPDAPRLRNMLPGLTTGAALGLLGLVPALFLTWGVEPTVVAAANRISVIERFPHHLWPLSFSSAKIAQHAQLLIVWFLIFFLVPSGKSQHGLRGIVNCSVAVSALGWAIALGLQDQPAISADLLQYYWFRLNDAILPVGVAIIGLSSVVQLTRIRPRIGKAWGATAMSGVMLFATYLMWNNPKRERSTGDDTVRYIDDWRKTCAWINANTPTDAVFITPWFAETFHWYAERSEVVNYKDCPHDAAGIVEWARRIRDLYPDPDTQSTAATDNVNDLSTHHVLKVGQLYKADYAIIVDSPQLELSQVGPKGLRYVIYRIPASSTPRNTR